MEKHEKKKEKRILPVLDGGDISSKPSDPSTKHLPENPKEVDTEIRDPMNKTNPGKIDLD